MFLTSLTSPSTTHGRRPTAMHPTAYLDQFTAATRDAHATLHAAAAAGMGTIEPQPHDPWIAAQAERLAQRLLTGRVHPCPHIGTTPALAQAAVWAPGRLVCPACARQLTPSPVEELTCDQCRHVTGVLYAGLVTVGPVLLAYGRCHTCTHRPHRTCPQPTRRHPR